MRQGWKIAGAAAALLAVFIYAGNASWLAPAISSKPVLLANRGAAQSFPRGAVHNDDCTARMIKPPRNDFLENTIPGIRAAFKAGATIVEIQIQPTTDGQFAVFHDATLDCRTEGRGSTRDHTMAELKRLDVGYGYTADGGRTFPLRGKGVGLMPSLDDVLTAFPGRRFLLALKNDGAADGEGLAKRLSRLPWQDRERLMVLTAGPRTASALARIDGLHLIVEQRLKSCLLAYIGLGWSGYIPTACQHTELLLPLNYARILWGWPNRFLARMRGADSEVFVAGDYHGGDGMGGIDTAGQFRRLPKNYSGGIWTDEILTIAPLAR